MKTLETLKVVLDATSEPLKRTIKTARREMEQFAKVTESQVKKAGNSVEKTKDPVKRVTDSIKEMNRQIKAFSSQAQVDAGIKRYTDEYMELVNNARTAEKQLKELQKQADGFSDKDKFRMSDEFKENEAAIRKAEEAAYALGRKQKEMRESGEDYQFTGEYQETINQLNKAKEHMKELGRQKKELEAESAKYGVGFEVESTRFQNIRNEVNETAKLISNLRQKIDELEIKGVHQEQTEGYKLTVVEAQKLEKELIRCYDLREQMKTDGTDQVESVKWRNIQASIAQATAEQERYNAAAAAKVDSGTHTESASAGFSSGSYIESAVATAQNAAAMAKPALSSVQQYAAGVKNSIAGVVKQIPFIGRFVTESAYLSKKGFSMMAHAASKVGSGISKAGGTAASLIKRFASGIPVIGRFTGAANKNSGAFGGGVKNLLKYGLGIRSLFVLVNKLRGALVEGFNNLSKFSSGTNSNLSLLSSQLSQLKNSLATAFEPILSVVTPVLSQLIDYVLGASNALAQFFAALTGKSSYNTAKRVNKDYAASLDKSASSASKATKENDKLKRTLMGFDEINKLDDDSSSGSGSGGGSGTSPAGDMFATESVGSQFSDLANMVKEAWQNADFTEIGSIVGTKINEVLQKISWDSIKETARKIAKSIVTFLNGAIDAIDWNLVGGTVAEGLNTAIEFGYTFVTTFNWSKFGKSIGEAVNGFFDKLDWAKAGKTLSEGFKGIFSVINNALEEIDWTQIGKDLGTFLTNIDWAGCLASVGTTIANVLIAALKLADGLFKAIKDGIKNVKWSEVADKAWGLFKKAWELIKTTISVGVSLLKNGWKSISSFVGGAVSVAISLAKKGWKKISSYVGSKVSVSVSLAKKGWTKLTDWIGGLTHTLKLKLPKIKVEWSTKKVAGFEIKYPSGFKTYKTGGFPEEGPFYMNRGEIAGKFSNGKGVVANNQQITAGIANAVGPAVYNATKAAMQEGGNTNRIIVTLEPDAKGLFRIVKTEAQNYTNSHGVSPFPV